MRGARLLATGSYLPGDAIEIEGYRFQVTTVDGRRVAQVRVVRARPPRKAA